MADNATRHMEQEAGVNDAVAAALRAAADAAREEVNQLTFGRVETTRSTILTPSLRFLHAGRE
jgi:hypothetical protein